MNPINKEDDPNSPLNQFHTYRMAMSEYLRMRDKVENNEIGRIEAISLHQKYNSHFGLLRERHNYMLSRAISSFYVENKGSGVFIESMISSGKIVIVCMIIKWLVV